jgi:succinate dehydrogenase / fumarate reductase cytochrome b subunit
MALDNRPLSPHLQIYKPQLTSVLSITHRGTGVFLAVGAFFLSCWLLALADGPEQFENLQTHLTNWYGQCLVYAFVFSLYFHLCNGIRHLCWDIGLGLDIDTTYKTGYAVVASTVVLTLLTLYLAAGGTA